MKKLHLIFILVFLLATCTLLFTSCESNSDTGANVGLKSEGTVKLNVFNWGEYISDGFEGSLDSNAAFEEYYFEKYGIRVEVNYSTYANNEDMYSKIVSGAGSYDIVIPSDYMIDKMIKEDLLLPFDATTVENYEYISPEFKSLYYDPENLYSIPYTYGMLGIIYNEALVDPEDYQNESWELLWNEKYKGKILQFNNPRDAFGSAMYYKGLDVNSTDPLVWEEALSILVSQKPLVQAYVNDEIFNKMTTASAAVAPYYAGDFITMASQNPDLKFYYPSEGVNLFVDAMCIPKSSRHPEVAKEYINFMLSEEPAIANALYIGYASPNTLVVENEEYLEEMQYLTPDAIDILYGRSPEDVNKSYNEMYGTTCYESFDPEIQALVNSLWESLKTENSTELWVHITTAVIVVSVVSFGVYNVYIKKKRSRDYRIRDRERRFNRSK